MPTITDPVAAMLVLAGLTYRGFYFLSIPHDTHERAVRRTVAAGLRTVAPVVGEWKLVWGPATAGSGPFDESAMYVVERGSDPALSAPARRQLVVAVRGTNPIALTDWTRGDFDVVKPARWPFGDETATVSGSTASGLNTLLQLTEPPPSQVGDWLEERVYSLSELIPDSVAAIIRPFKRDRDQMLFPVVDRLSTLLDLWSKRMKQEGAEVVAGDVVRKLTELSQKTTTVVSWPSPPPTGLGATLVDFLIKTAKDGPVDLIVTGHSKGGALAPALALWLAETRSRWDPKGNASIGCYTFAGPTPGNAAFGRRVGDKLDGATRRVINTSDIATHAWDRAGLESIAKLYDLSLEWTRPILEAVNANVVQDPYEPVSLPTDTFDGVGLRLLPAASNDPATQIPNQHLEAYLARFGLLAATPRIDTLLLLLRDGDDHLAPTSRAAFPSSKSPP